MLKLTSLATALALALVPAATAAPYAKHKCKAVDKAGKSKASTLMSKAKKGGYTAATLEKS